MTTRREFLVALGGLGLLASGCEVGFPRPATEKVEHPGVPYHPLAFQLDLAAFAYHLYGQSLALPFDPYYESQDVSEGQRVALMDKVRSWAQQEGKKQRSNPGALGAYRGPGVLGSFPNNPTHDPILYRYDQLYPWSRCLTYPGSKWLFYKTPGQITRAIRDVYVAYRPTGVQVGAGEPQKISLKKLSLQPTEREQDKNAKDCLLCFEGGTGDKGEEGQPHSQSLMGFVLLRWDGGEFDVHIAFRGSRSGSAARALLEANSTLNPKGNPDWITDLGWFQISPEEGAAAITDVGKVYRGFARSVSSILPALVRCLQEVSSIAGGAKPRNLTVTGHSLGGGLAQQFAGAVSRGEVYGPGGQGPGMPKELRSWPWKQLKLVTFSSPRAGDEVWAKTMTEEVFQSRFFSHPVFQVDVDAFTAKQREIVPRLLNPKKPAAFRVLISNDPITTEKIVGGKHIGQTVYLDAGRTFVPSFVSHEVYKLRELMSQTLNDDRIPNEDKSFVSSTWQYFPPETLYPSLLSATKGGKEEIKARVSILQKFYSERAIPHDKAALERSQALFLQWL